MRISDRQCTVSTQAGSVRLECDGATVRLNPEDARSAGRRLIARAAEAARAGLAQAAALRRAGEQLIAGAGETGADPAARPALPPTIPRAA